MAVTITLEQVKANPIANGYSDDVLNGFIAFVDQADACLDANNVPDDVQTAIKLNGVWALCYNSRNGNVKSERSPNGAQISYGDLEGISANPYGQTLGALDVHYCVRSLFGQTGMPFIFGAVK